MSNIRRLGDYDDFDNNANIRERFRGDFETVPPRKETFGYFLRSLLCSNYKLKSFTAIFSIFMILIYFVTLCSGIQESKEHFLGPNPAGPVFLALIKDQNKVRNGEVWRWFTYSILHGDFAHIAFNLLSLTIFGSLLEKLILWKRFIALYTVSGILGALFSSLIIKGNAVGASVCIYGVIGAYVSLLKLKI